MLIIIKLLVIALVTKFIMSACEVKSINEEHKRIVNESEQLIQKYIDLDIFSGVVLLAENGKPFYHKAFGEANRELKIPNKLNTKFDVGSMNKTFTKIIIMQLVAEAKLNLDDKIGKHLDGFPTEAADNITIDHLLYHSSGYGDYHSPDFFEATKEQKTIPALVERIKTQPLLFQPGEEQEYSNAGYILLGAVIEKVTGKTYHKNVRERIVEPLELNETYVDNKDAVPDRSIGYYKNMRGEIFDNENEMEVPNPDGGFQSTAGDILRFYQEYFYGNTLLSEQTKAGMEEFSIYEKYKNTDAAIPQAGGFPGANTAYYEILRDRISIIVLANMDEPVAEQITEGILAIIRGKIPPEPVLPANQLVYSALMEKDAAFVKQNFEELTRNFHPTDPKDLILNNIGYELLFEGSIDDAVKAFELNVELFPEVANCYDSLGEALLKKGDKAGALKNYKKALELDPEMPSAKRMVRELSE